MHFSGYATVTDTPYDMGWYTEQISRGAFKKTLAEKPDVVLNISHGDAASGLPVARTKSGTLRLHEDGTGLAVEADLDPEDPDVQLIGRKMKRGDLDGQMSFAFRCVRQSWNADYTERSISEADIHRGDVSIVVQGANPATSSAVRSMAARAGRSASLAERRQMAGAVGGGLVVVETRSFRLDGQEYSFREPTAAACNRCNGEREIILQGHRVTCPQCSGDGGPSGNAPSGDSSLSYVPSYVGIARARLRLAELRVPPLVWLEREAAAPSCPELRAKYTQAEIDALGAKGHAFKNPDGSFSYPIDDVEDLKNAIHAVGRGNANHNRLRLYIIGRAKALGESDLIPDTWNLKTGALK